MIDEDEPLLEKAMGTEIDWYPGKCLTQNILKKKPKKGANNAKPVTKTKDCESFFNFFNPPQVPDEDEDIDEDKAEELQNLMEQDNDIGSTIWDKISPRAVSWITVEAMEEEEFEIDDDEEANVDEEEDEDEDDDEDEDEDEEEADDEDGEESKIKRKPSSGHTGRGGRGGDRDGGGGRGNGGGRHSGKGHAEKISAEDLDADLDKYHSCDMETN